MCPVTSRRVVFECRLLSRFCHFAHAYPSTHVVEYAAGTLASTYFLRTRRYVTVHTLLSRSTYMGFFSQTPYDPPCRLYNSNLGSFLSRIIGYTLFCARRSRLRYGREARRGMARGRFGIFLSRKEKEFRRRFVGNFMARLTRSISVNVMK